jgi:hypothetical protein
MMGLHVLDHSTQFLTFGVLLGSAYLLAENSLNAPTITLGEDGKFIHLTLVVLNVGTNSGKNTNLIHN